MALTKEAFEKSLDFNNPDNRARPPENATFAQERAWWDARNEWDKTRTYGINNYGSGALVQNNATEIVGPNGKSYVYVPKEYVLKGSTFDYSGGKVGGVRTDAGKYQAYNPAYLNPETFQNAYSYTLPENTQITNQYFNPKSFENYREGFIFPTEYYNKNIAPKETSYEVKDYAPAIQGLTNLNSEIARVNSLDPSQYVYQIDTSRPDSNTAIQKVITSSGYGGIQQGSLFKDLGITYTPNKSKGFLGVGGFVGDTLNSIATGINDLSNSLGPVGKLALLVASIESGGLGSLFGSGAGAGAAEIAASDIAGLADVGMGANTSLLGGLELGALGTASDLAPSFNNSSLYSLAPSSPLSGTGLQATIGEGTNLFSTGTNVGTDALGTGLTLPETSNLASMGGGQGLTVPAAGGGLLGEAGVGSAVTAVTNPVTGQPMGQELSNINTGVTDVAGTPTGTSGLTTEEKVAKKIIEKAIGSTMADNTSNVAGGLLTAAGGAISGEAAKTANQAAADALKTATTAATTGATFRPVGITTRYGSSTYTYDPTTGQLTAAGYTPTALSDTLQTGAKSVYDLGSKYVAQSPEEAAKSWLTAQQNLLKPGQDVALANLRNQLFQSGREGLSVAQGGDLMAANPELAAYYNSLANQNALLASQAQQFGQKQAEFGTGLLGSGLKLMGGVETLAQNPFDLSTKLAASVSGAGANAGRLNLAGTEAAQRFSVPAGSYSPFGNLMAAAGSNPAFSSALGGLFTQYAPQLSNWWNSLSATPGGGGITSNFTLPDYGTDNFWSY